LFFHLILTSYFAFAKHYKGKAVSSVVIIRFETQEHELAR